MYFWFCHIGAASLDPCQASFLFKKVQRLTHRGAAYAMAKGTTTIDGMTYYFDPATGVKR